VTAASTSSKLGYTTRGLQEDRIESELRGGGRKSRRQPGGRQNSRHYLGFCSIGLSILIEDTVLSYH